MRITDLISKESIDMNFSAKTKLDAVDKLVNLIDKTGYLTNKDKFKTLVLEREKESTTGIGNGIAIPHAKSEVVKKPALAVALSKKGVNYDSLDGESCDLFFMIAAPDNEDNVHLDVLSKLSTLLMNDEFTKKLKNSKSADELLTIIDNAEKAKSEKMVQNDNNAQYQILAVTACPTGIAHTYMAQESLENKAKEMGVSIKVETNGSGGIKNKLTSEEIENCQCVIIAADTKVEMERFNGKKVIITSVANGIHKPKDLIDKAMNGNVPIYKSDTNLIENTELEKGKNKTLRTIYKHLMSGISAMLPFVIGGGILIAISFLLDDYSINPSNFGSNTPAAKFFNQIGGLAFSFMLPILAGFIAYSIADKPGLAVGFVGGALAATGYNFYATNVSAGFLGAIAAGFIAGYIIVGLRKLCKRLPKSLDGIKSILIYPLFGILTIGVIMYFGFNYPFAQLNMAINNGLKNMGNTNIIILATLVAGMMAVDMGGPINKAAYTFGTATLIAGTASVSSPIMAAVMIGGMVPPLGIALATTFFRRKFTVKERKDGVVNYLMGLSFITEGAIPFAAADPLRVIPSCIAGSAVAGALSAAFKCSIRAPHGGIFVIGIISNAGMYILALLIGSVVTMIMLGLLKKTVDPNARSWFSMNRKAKKNN